MLYVVYVSVAASRAEEWQAWMIDEHIQEVVDTGYFADAVMAREPDADEPGLVAFRTIYRAHSEAALDEYQSTEAPRLKADHVARFGEDARARRDLLPVIRRFEPSSPMEDRSAT